MYNNDLFQNMNMDSTVTGNNDVIENNMNIDINNNNQMMPMNNNGVQERVINRTFVHEVPQPCPFMTEKREVLLQAIKMQYNVAKRKCNFPRHLKTLIEKDCSFAMKNMSILQVQNKFGTLKQLCISKLFLF